MFGVSRLELISARHYIINGGAVGNRTPVQKQITLSVYTLSQLYKLLGGTTDKAFTLREAYYFSVKRLRSKRFTYPLFTLRPRRWKTSVDGGALNRD